MLEILFVAIAVGGAAWFVMRPAERNARALLGTIAVVAVGVLAVRIGIEQSESTDPHDLTDVDYRTSDGCVKCHAAEHASWMRTFHRTMTQEATPNTVIGDFADVELEYYGHPCRLYREGDTFYMELVDGGWERETVQRGIDPATVPDPPRRRYRVDRVVGSNQMQIYLYRAPDGTYLALPLEWNNREKRWVTAAGNYLQPPSDTPWLFAHVATWNETCIFCHNTRPNPGMQDAAVFDSTGRRYDSQVEELGIACEACHGPSDLHEKINRDPTRRFARARDDRADPTIVHPARLEQQASLDLCGRCHGKFGVRMEFREEVFAHGDLFVPAQMDLSTHYREPTERAEHASGRMNRDGYFWPDGTPRPTAMEYQGVKLSPCGDPGPMTCLDCHSMHDADPVDQLKYADDPTTSAFEDDEACLQCHATYRDGTVVRAHTHHAPTSEGSRCVNCHMPFATFGLMKTVRTHRVVSPDARNTAETRFPNGCNQCHVDRSLAWTAQWLTEWYGAEPLPFLGDARDALALTTVELVAGHALNRAIAAASLGWGPAIEAAPGDWAVPLLLEAMDDEYAAVRLNAWVALREREGLAPERFDYLAPPARRRAVIDALLAEWRARDRAELPATLAVDARSGLVDRWREDLRAVRDRTPLTILE